ncbi:Uncharacterized protein PECH_002239 [Penicillium ucsense]|uniref:Uncharacterized protein n=1 Tax=Penicillium ucsense TaxID=2839758 RepID=A0A8J8W1N8_9EURO|nr:Uncharacterized protein PECM_008663 [Penicillium ucsense]KAF7731113.1 Uncharacterized protein PECH_002239 [Penicillium ucsense]
MASPEQQTRNRGFSVKSDKSHKSNTSGHKSHLSESSQEKARRSLQTKADPTVAMNELQPMAVALEKSNMGSLRAIEHKDQFGNPITEPDWSNPTRPRYERPLDTIRSFEAAIYGTYVNNRPGSYIRTDDAASQMGDYTSRRTSYHGGQNGGYSSRGYNDQNAYYGRNAQSRPDSLIDGYGNSSQAPDNYYPYNNQNGNGRRPRHMSRMSTDQSGYGNGNGNHLSGQYAYQQQNYDRSHDNAAGMSGSGSGYTDSHGQSTDPSSLNSSLDQLQQQQQRADERGSPGYGPPGYGGGSQMSGPGRGASAVPGWGPSAAGTPSRGPPPLPKPQMHDDKKKGWFKKRFSRG